MALVGVVDVVFKQSSIRREKPRLVEGRGWNHRISLKL